MRGSVASRLRKKVYGDLSRRNPGQYRTGLSGQVLCVGKRGDYLEEKAAYKAGER
jgi:hypothetical protein